MTGRELCEWLKKMDALDLPLILRGFDGDGDDEVNVDADLTHDRLSTSTAGEVTIWCP